MRYRILIVSDSVEWCESLNTGFKLNGSFHVLGILSTPELIDSGVSLYPDVVLWEVNDDPLPVISEIKTKSPFSRLVIILREPGQYNMVDFMESYLHGCCPNR